MQRAFIASLVFHLTVVAVAYVGVPMIRRDAPLVETPIVVDVVTVAEITNAPPPKIVEEPKPAPEKKPPPPPPPPEPEPAPEPAPRAEPAPKPKREKKPVEEAKPKPKPDPPPMLASVKPKRKPKPPSRFASVLRTIEKLKDRPPPPEDEPEKKEQKAEGPKESFETQVARALSKRQQADFDPTAPLTISEIDLVRQQIAKCWSLPAGAKDAEGLIIEVRVEMNIDGRPRVAEIKDQARMRADPFFRAAAETALRAVLNPRCHPFKLPAEKFDRWRTMTLVFNPKEMFGT